MTCDGCRDVQPDCIGRAEIVSPATVGEAAWDWFVAVERVPFVGGELGPSADEVHAVLTAESRSLPEPYLSAIGDLQIGHSEWLSVAARGSLSAN